MLKHQISLNGPNARGVRISAVLLKDLLDVIVDGTRGALRLKIEGRSFARGSDPAWLGRAADFEITGLNTGSTLIERSRSERLAV